jgi:sec-independent protein translocase protein TatB
MFDIGWTELLIVGVVALIVIGPKDLPEMFRTLGRFTTKARGMARDFQRAMEAAADEAGVKDVAKDLKDVTSARSMGLDAVKNAATKFEKWDPLKPTPKPVTPAAPAAPVASASMGPATQALAEAQAAKRAALSTPPAPTLQADPEAPPPKAKAKAAPKPKAPKAPKAEAAQKPVKSKAAVEPKVVAKPARAPRAKKTDGGKTDA